MFLYIFLYKYINDLRTVNYSLLHSAESRQGGFCGVDRPALPKTGNWEVLLLPSTASLVCVLKNHFPSLTVSFERSLLENNNLSRSSI